MFDDLDRTIEKLLELDIGNPLPFDVSFAVPDKSFTPLSSTRSTLNCYLYDIRDDRDLRVVAPTLAHNPDGTLTRSFTPARIKATYSVTAWSPAQRASGTEPAIDEHGLLGRVLGTLLRYPTVPADALVGSLAAPTPAPPTTVAMADDRKVGGDFWTAIGGTLRPSLDYSVTIALDYQPDETGPVATTIQVDEGPGDRIVLIGGVVYDSSSPPAPVAGAWVRIIPSGSSGTADPEQVVIADAVGRFVVDCTFDGSYTLTVRAIGFREASRTVTVPSLDGNYDVTLIPL